MPYNVYSADKCKFLLVGQNWYDKCVEVHRRTSLMIFVMGGKWLYNCCFCSDRRNDVPHRVKQAHTCFVCKI